MIGDLRTSPGEVLEDLTPQETLRTWQNNLRHTQLAEQPRVAGDLSLPGSPDFGIRGRVYRVVRAVATDAAKLGAGTACRWGRFAVFRPMGCLATSMWGCPTIHGNTNE